jgi:hypothetical protein
VSSRLHYRETFFPAQHRQIFHSLPIRSHRDIAIGAQWFMHYAKLGGAMKQAYARGRYFAKKFLGYEIPRVAFLHIPKCAGSSINHHFKANYGGSRWRNSVLLDSALGSAFCDRKRLDALNAQYVSGHMGWQTFHVVSRNAFRLTVLRDPVSRLKSLYLFSRNREKSNHKLFIKLMEAARDLSFLEFCISDDPDLQAMTDNTQARQIACDYYPFQPYEDEAVFSAAKENLLKFDMVLTTEAIDIVMPRIADITDTLIVSKNLRKNKTIKKDAQEFDLKSIEENPIFQKRISIDKRLYEFAIEGRNRDLLLANSNSKQVRRHFKNKRARPN